MTRKAELAAELKTLYERSRRAIHTETIKQYEAKISYLEQEMAIISTIEGQG